MTHSQSTDSVLSRVFFSHLLIGFSEFGAIYKKSETCQVVILLRDNFCVEWRSYLGSSKLCLLLPNDVSSAGRFKVSTFMSLDCFAP